MSESQPTAEARYRSKCAGCGEWIEEGDAIYLDQDSEEWVCEWCK